MSLSEHMYGPHVLVCVRVRGAFQKKKKKSDSTIRFYIVSMVDLVIDGPLRAEPDRAESSGRPARAGRPA